MIRDYFVFDNVPSTDFGTFLADSNLFDAPAKDVTREKVPGRNGEILISNNRFENFEGKATVAIPFNLPENVEALKAFLHSRSGYHRYQETYHPNKFRMASFESEFTMGAMNKTSGSLELTFNCKPQIYLIEGDVEETHTAAFRLMNPTLFAAQPMLRVKGYGFLWIGNYGIQIGQNSLSYLDIDCERMDVYYGDTNCNNMVALCKLIDGSVTNSSDFPKLEPGETYIHFDSTIKQVAITPRWWTI